MSDLTDKKDDFIVISPDAKTRTAFDTWKGGLKTEEQANLSVVDDKYIVSAPDPEDLMKVTRDELVDIVAANAETPTDIVRIRFSGTRYASAGIIIQCVADPDDIEESK